MQIKNESELANILGMAFQSYANRVQRGLTGVYKPLLAGEDKVLVSIKLTEPGEIMVEEGPDIDVFKAEINLLEGKVKSLQNENESLNLLIEEQKPEESVLRDVFSSADGDVLEQTELAKEAGIEYTEVTQEEVSKSSPKKTKKKGRAKRK